MALHGSVHEQTIFDLIGPGADGKSVFVEVLQHVMGRLAAEIPPKVQSSGRDEHPTVLMFLRGARRGIASEPRACAQSNVSVLKRLSGRDTLTARAAEW